MCRWNTLQKYPFDLYHLSVVLPLPVNCDRNYSSINFCWLPMWCSMVSIANSPSHKMLKSHYWHTDSGNSNYSYLTDPLLVTCSNGISYDNLLMRCFFCYDIGIMWGFPPIYLISNFDIFYVIIKTFHICRFWSVLYAHIILSFMLKLWIYLCL